MRAVAIASASAVLLLLAVHTLTPRKAGAPVRAHATAAAPPRPIGGGDPVDSGGVAAGASTDLALWHVTDWHLNLYHDARGDVVDMCRSRTADPLRWPDAAGHWNCDPSMPLAAAAVARMSALAPPPAAILLGGDSFGHVPPAHDRLDAVLASHTAMHALLTTAFPRTPVLPILGNHDTWPYFSKDRRAARHLAQLWGQHLSPSAAAGLAEHGYYMHTLHASVLGGALPGSPPLTVVCLDTNALSLPETGDGSDGGGGVLSARAQLQWLDSTLGRLPNRSALILGHIPPGASHVDYDSMAAAGWQGGGLQAWPQRRLYAVLARHSRAVAALLFGHLHTPSIRLLPPGPAQQQNRGPMPVAYVSPSLTLRNPTPHGGGVRRYMLRAEGGAGLTARYGAGGGGRGSSKWMGGNGGFAGGLVGSGARGGVRASANGSPSPAPKQNVAAHPIGGFVVMDMLDLLFDLPDSARPVAILGRGGGALPRAHGASAGTSQTGGGGGLGAPWAAAEEVALGAASGMASAAAAAAMAAVSRGDGSGAPAAAEATRTPAVGTSALPAKGSGSAETSQNSAAAAAAQMVAMPSWRVLPSVRTELGLPSLSESAWRSWLNRLCVDDAYFCAQMPPQRCADEIEPDYAKCKAAVVCAVSEGEPVAYAACLRQIRASAVPPEACRMPARKREPP